MLFGSTPYKGPSNDDREACKKIEDELRRRGLTVHTFHYGQQYRHPDPHVALIGQDSPSYRWREASAETYGHALCLAVLAVAEA